MVLVILQTVADCHSTTCGNNSAYCSTGKRISDCRAYERAATHSDSTACQRTFFTRGQGLTRTPDYGDHRSGSDHSDRTIGS
jgi:hypothetical protein